MAEKKFGELAFIVGIVIAIFVSFVPLNGQIGGFMALLLVVLGLVVGFLNVSKEETTSFLVASAALLLSSTTKSSLDLIPVIGSYLSMIVTNVGVFVAPAAIVVALIAIKHLAKD